MFKSNLEKAFNEQLNAELYSSYLYLSMAAYLESVNLKGMAQWMKIQAQEEVMHAMKFFNYIHDRGGKVKLTQIDAPKTTFESPLDIFKETYEHECKVSQLINYLVTLSKNENDYASHSFLQWFVEEQVEEEASALEIYEKLKLIKSDGAALFFLDKELGSRPAVDINKD